MKKSKITKSALFSSMVALFLCFSMLLGTTFAWFTDSEVSGNNIIVAGNLDMGLSYKPYGAENTEWKPVEETTVLFGENALYEPGYTEAVWFKVENLGSLAFRYDLSVNVANEKPGINKAGDQFNLSDYLEVRYLTATSTDMESNFYTTRESLNSFAWGSAANSGVVSLKNEVAMIKNGVAYAKNDAVNGAYNSAYVLVVISMPTTVGNEANHNGTVPEIDFTLTAVATQVPNEKDSFGSDYDANAEYPELKKPWNGSVDTSWYNPNDTVFTLSTPEQFAGLALLVGTTDQFEGKTINLADDIDLNGKSFAPIGTTGQRDDRNRLITKPFKGTFDGQGHAVENISQSGWDFGYEWGQYGSIGLFSELESATVKNVTISGYDAAIEGGDIGGICGSATGTCVFENITIKDSGYGTYNNGIGGIIGWSGAGHYTFKDITITDDVIFGGLWGSFDSSVGGIVGQGEPGATYIFDNVDVACRLDVFNDCTASYDYYNYRMSGMLIGRLEETTTIDSTNYPDTSKYNIVCNDVTVTYGDWMNYHYCDPTPGHNGGRGMRVETGYAYDGIPAGYDHSQCTTHHNELIPFDQIFGGAQYGVKGLKTYPGVTVEYPNP